jgi:hypothetical protein
MVDIPGGTWYGWFMDNNHDNWMPAVFSLADIPAGHSGYRTAVRCPGSDWDEVAVWVRSTESVADAVRRCQTVQDLYGPDFEVHDLYERVI